MIPHPPGQRKEVQHPQQPQPGGGQPVRHSAPHPRELGQLCRRASPTLGVSPPEAQEPEVQKLTLLALRPHTESRGRSRDSQGR